MRRPTRSDLLTIAAVAVVAYALCDLVHEVLGHGVAALLTPRLRIVSLSSVALQSEGTHTRLVAAAGSIANVIAGAIALTLFHRRPKRTATGYFAWLFAVLNLMNGTGYLFFTAIFGYGDWQTVIDGLTPAWLWRLALGIAGAVSYVAVVKVAARELARAVGLASLRRSEVARIVMTSYWAGGTLLVAASIFNPIGPSLILASGASSGFAAMAGLVVIPRLVERQVSAASGGDGIVPRSPGWIVIGIAVAAVFVGVIGRGIAFGGS